MEAKHLNETSEATLNKEMLQEILPIELNASLCRLDRVIKRIHMLFFGFGRIHLKSSKWKFGDILQNTSPQFSRNNDISLF